MTQSTFKMTGIVLRKTKLAESDLIITLISSDGSLKKGVAKGARKPNSAFSSRLELYNKVDLLCACGKSLDIIKEARLEFCGTSLHVDLDKSLAAASISDLTCKFIQPELDNPILFEMIEKCLQSLEVAHPDQISSLVAAYYLKCFSICGIRPNLATCLMCGSNMDSNAKGLVSFSYEDGGYLCNNCASAYATIKLSAQTLSWANVLLYSTFDKIINTEVPSPVIFEILQICQQWCCVHVGSQVKSLKMFVEFYAVV